MCMHDTNLGDWWKWKRKDKFKLRSPTSTKSWDFSSVQTRNIPTSQFIASQIRKKFSVSIMAFDGFAARDILSLQNANEI